MQNLEDEITFAYIRASGPGGQNVNKVATAVQLRFDIAHSLLLGAEVRARLLQLAGRKVTAEGVLIISAARFRTQEQNRADALARFYDLVSTARQRPKPRRATRPTKAAKEERIKAKKQRGAVKKLRRTVDHS